MLWNKCKRVEWGRVQNPRPRKPRKPRRQLPSSRGLGHTWSHLPHPLALVSVYIPRAGILGMWNNTSRLKIRIQENRFFFFAGREGVALLAWWEGHGGAEGSRAPLRWGVAGQQEDGRPGFRKEDEVGAERPEHASRGAKSWVPESKTSRPLGFPTSLQPLGEQGGKPRQDVPSSHPETIPSHTHGPPRRRPPLLCGLHGYSQSG